MPDTQVGRRSPGRWLSSRAHGRVPPSDCGGWADPQCGGESADFAALYGETQMSKPLLLGVAVLFSACRVGAEDWPQFLGPNRNGVSSEAGMDTSWPKDGPRVVWECEVGAGWSGPVVAAGRLILFHRHGDEEI